MARGIFHRLFKITRGVAGFVHVPTDKMFGLSSQREYLHAFFATNVTDNFDDHIGVIGVRKHATEHDAMSIFEFRVKPEFFRTGVATDMLRHILLTYRTYARKIIIDIPKEDVKLKDLLHNNNFMLASETKNRFVFIHWFNFKETRQENGSND